MRRAACAAVLALFSTGAAAQGLPSVTVPGQGQSSQTLPAPLPGQTLPNVPPPSAAPAPIPAPPAAAPIQPVQSEWVAMPAIELRVIDKVMARTTALAGRVGDTLQAGPLAVLVRACIVRPPDQAPDAAAFLEIGESGRPPMFHGWMIRSVPQLAVLEHPTIDVRLAGCRP